MSQTIQVPPEQLPQFIEQNKATKDALEKILLIKRSVMEHLEAIVQLTSPRPNSPTGHANAIAANSPFESSALDTVGACFHHFALAQLIEYELQVKGFEEKLSQTNEILSKLESAIIVPTGPAIKPGFGGFKPPKI